MLLLFSVDASIVVVTSSLSLQSMLMLLSILTFVKSVFSSSSGSGAGTDFLIFDSAFVFVAGLVVNIVADFVVGFKAGFEGGFDIGLVTFEAAAKYDALTRY